MLWPVTHFFCKSSGLVRRQRSLVALFEHIDPLSMLVSVYRFAEISSDVIEVSEAEGAPITPAVGSAA